MKAAATEGWGLFFILLGVCAVPAGCGRAASSPSEVACAADAGAAAAAAQSLFLAGTDHVLAFKIDVTTGALGAPTTVVGPNDPSGIAGSATANLLFVSDFGAQAVNVYSVSADGTFVSTSSAPLPPGEATAPLPRPGAAATDPAGKYLYVDDMNSGAVDVFAIGADGSLSLVAGSPFPAGKTPMGVAVDPTGKFVYASNSYDPKGGVSAYASSAGVLTPISGSPFATGSSSAGPGPLAVHPNGRFLFVCMTGNVNPNHLISVFKIDPATGALVTVAGSPFATGSGPTSMTLDSAGRFLYTADTQQDTVSAFAVDPTTGALAHVAGSPYHVPSIGGLTVDASGRYLYAASGTAVAGFAIDPCHGGLTSLPSSPFATGLRPSGSAGLLISSIIK